MKFKNKDWDKKLNSDSMNLECEECGEKLIVHGFEEQTCPPQLPKPEPGFDQKKSRVKCPMCDTSGANIAEEIASKPNWFRCASCGHCAPSKRFVEGRGDPYDPLHLLSVGALAEFSGVTSDGSTASYYELPEGATELQHLISHRDMNAQIGEIFRACYRYGQASHSGRLRDAKKIRFYIEAEISRLEKLEVGK